MQEYKAVTINNWLRPFSWAYGFVVWFRNKLFDWNILKQKVFDVPVICVGNITAGGTGKTPHVEYLVSILIDKHRVAVLSRGYKRKTRGFYLASSESTFREIGDEPYQIKQKFPEVIVAVDSKRSRGIEHLLELENPPDIIILDDAFQHRYVKPSHSIILSNFNRPIYEDTLLPAGRLRESVKSVRGASMVIITKCPEDLKPIDFRIISHDIDILPYQDLFFTSFEYKHLQSVFDKTEAEKELNELKDKSILLVTGIASPDMIVNELSLYTDKVEVMAFKDHYNFKKKDIQKITKQFESIESKGKIILVTEKDAARLVARDDIGDEMKSYFYYLPIEVKFSQNESELKFKDKIYKHVKEYKRNSKLYTK